MTKEGCFLFYESKVLNYVTKGAEIDFSLTRLVILGYFRKPSRLVILGYFRKPSVLHN
jgi:hypothetical protein